MTANFSSFSISVLNTRIHFYELTFLYWLITLFQKFSIANEIYENIWFLLSQFISELRLIAKEKDDSGAYLRIFHLTVLFLAGRYIWHK